VTCDKAREVLSDYLSGSLPSEEAAGVEAHLASCEGCANELEALKRTDTLLFSLSSEEAPEAVWQATAARIERTPQGIGFFDWLLSPRVGYTFAAACAVVALAVLMFPVSLDVPQPEGAATYIELPETELPLAEFARGAWNDQLSDRGTLGMLVSGAATVEEGDGDVNGS